MRVAIIAAVIGLVVLAGIAVSYYVSQAAVAKKKAMEMAERRVSAGFRQHARYALALLDSHDASRGDISNAMALAESTQANDADRTAMLMLVEYQTTRSTFEGYESDKKAYKECRAAAQSLIESQVEATHEVTQPCIAAAHEQASYVR